MGEIVLVRHGQTEWSRDGRHTGRSDIPLTEHGREQARTLGPALQERSYELVLTSPLSRAVETCREAGLGDEAELDADLVEWDYGEYEGLTSRQIRAGRPDWSLWGDGCPGGESPADVGKRADRVLARVAGLEGDAIVFSHGHFLRVLASRWVELEPSAGSKLGLDVATLCVLGHEHETDRVIRVWNAPLDLTQSRSERRRAG
jgi:broad specificity phosphatase PhoE